MAANLEPAWRDRQFYEPEIETADRAEIARMQEKQILELVPYLWERSTFYRELWSAAGVDPDSIRSIEDFVRRIPTTCKEDVIAFRDRTGDPFGGLLCVDPSELTSITATSGTTALPEPLPEIWTVAPPLPTVSARDLWAIGLRPGDRVMIAPGTLRNFYDDYFHMLGLVPVFVDSWVGEGAQMLRAIEQHQIRFMIMLLPQVLEFERMEPTHDIRSMVSSLKGAGFAGQPLGKNLAHKIRDDWGINLYVYTSAGDTGTAWEGPEHDGFYLWEDTVFAETLDPVTGAAVGDRELGELVATDLDNRVAPYVRWRSGDLVRITRDPGPGGRTHARMWLAGRKGDDTVIAGKIVMMREVWDLVESIPELSDGMFQIIRYAPEMERLRIRAGYAPERTHDLDELCRRTTEVLHKGLGVEVEIQLTTVDDLLSKTASVAKFARMVKA